MPASGAEQLRLLSARLRAAGTEGQGLRRALYRAIDAAARPLAEEIGSTAHLDPYLPNRYAAVLASDLTVTVSKRGTVNPAVTIRARGRVRRRQVVALEGGRMRHPVFADAKESRRDWRWVNQTAGLKPGFFTDPCRQAAPRIRDEILAAMHDTGQKITGG
jgi:hypothetical protein